MSNREDISVSVIVPCRNERSFIQKFLESVHQQDTKGLNVEVLLADGISDDGTREALNEYRNNVPNLRMIDNPEKMASAGLNAGIRAAKGDIIIRMDVHTDYAPDYIQNCVRLLNETGAANVGGPALTRADGFVAEAIALAYHSRFACGGAKFHDSRYEGFVDTVTYGCWRKATLERFGMFDETLYRCQDNDLNFRLIAAGEKIWQSPKIVSWYRPRKSLLALFRQYLQYGFWKVAVIRKHRKPASWRHVVPGSSLIVVIGMLLGLGGAILCGSQWWISAFAIPAAAMAGIYLAASIGAALLLAKREGWRYFPIFPIVFATYHASYGLGFLLGLSYRPKALDRPSPLLKVLTAITR